MYMNFGYYGQAPTPPGCNREELGRRVDACINQTRNCLMAATAKVGRAMVTCRTPWCRAAAMARFWMDMRRCRERLLACDAAAKRDTRCA